jgi:predicted RNA-binding Zn ribbon-like protein
MTEVNDAIVHGDGSGAICLDYANTVDWHASSHPKNMLDSYEKLVEWSRRRGLLDSEVARGLVQRARDRKELGDVAMGEADSLREAIYGVFSATSHGKPPGRKELDTLNAHLSRGMARSRIDVEGNQLRWGWNGDDLPLDMMLWPIAKSAADLLTSERLGQVKECANEVEGCGWLFLDTSRSHNRVWCSMDSCGNRAKFRAYYDRHNRPISAKRRSSPKAF